MNIKIHRGINQIGGNIIEISTNTTKILLDVGLELDDEKNKELPTIEGLFEDKGYDAVFLSHYHGDHMGLAYQINSDIPLYMGENSYKIVNAADLYKKEKSMEPGQVRMHITPAGFMEHKVTIEIGDLRVTPYLCDHSAFDSYMILVENGNESVLYTGDFRSNGRKPFDWLLNQLPTKVDVLICEGTTLSKEDYKCETEKELEERCWERFSKTQGPIFLLQSSMNIDRIVTMFRAAKKCNRVFLQDLYIAEITNAIEGSIPNPNGFNDVNVFTTRSYHKEHFRYKLFNKYGKNKISKKQITKTKFVMCIRTSMLEYLKSLEKEISFNGGLLAYSLWNGYKEQSQMKEFLKACENMGLIIVELHTGGHADIQAIRALVSHVNPTKIIPVHTEKADWFLENYREKVMLT